jgi:hypothetical protein
MGDYPSSPLIPLAPTLYAICRPHTALALAHLKRESEFETDRKSLEPDDHNCFNLRPNDLFPMPAGATGVKANYLTFDSYQACARQWLWRITDPDYYRRLNDGTIVRYSPTMTLRQYIDIYAPVGDEHQTTGDKNETYYADIVTMLTRFAREERELAEDPPPMNTYPVLLGGGKYADVPSLVPIVQAILPANMPRVRPGNIIKARAWCQHENGNPKHKAANERKYFHDGAEGRQASYHFVGDDTIVYQLLPLNENGWHAGDNLGPGNMASIAGSIAQGAKDMAKARKVMEHLAAGVMLALGIPADATRQHYDFAPNRKDCPQWIRRDGYWPTFQANVKRNITAIVVGEGKPEPVKYATPVQIAALDIAGGTPPAKMILDDGSLAIYVGDRVRAKKATPRLQRSSASALRIGPDIKAGEEFDVDWLIQTAPGEPWFYYTPWDTRVIADDCERISDAKAVA